MREATDRQGRPVQQCPQCGNSIVRGIGDEPLSLPAECSNCIAIANERAREAERPTTDQPDVLTSGELVALRRNVAGLQGDVSKLTAQVLAMAGDMADLRRTLGTEQPELAAAAPTHGRRR